MPRIARMMISRRFTKDLLDWQERHQIGKGQENEHQGGHDPQNNNLKSATPGSSAGLIRRTIFLRPVGEVEGRAQGNQCESNEVRTIRRERRGEGETRSSKK